MATRTITLTLDLTEEAARHFDEAHYEFDSIFTDELEEEISYRMKKGLRVNLSHTVIDVALTVKASREAFEREQAEDLMLERGVTCYG